MREEWNRDTLLFSIQMEKVQNSLSKCSKALFNWSKVSKPVDEKLIIEITEVLGQLPEDEAGYNFDVIR